MSEGIPYADIVILALIAGFILLRLRSVLGQKMEDDPFFRKETRAEIKQSEPIVQVNEKSLKPRPKEEKEDTYLAQLDNRPLAETLKSIKTKDPQFTATAFLEGAKMAFEMVFDAFAKGDRTILKMLLSAPVFEEFSNEIDAREKEPHRRETTLVSVQAKDITQAVLTGSMARLTVQFLSEQISVVRDEKGEIIEGDVSELHSVEDHWVFERDVTSKNPNWKIIET